MPADEKTQVQNEPPLHNCLGGLACRFVRLAPLSELARSKIIMNTTTRAVIMVASGILVANIVDRMFIQPNLG